MDKIKKILNRNKKKAVLVAVVLCVLVIIAVVLVLNGGNGSGDRKGQNNCMTMQKRKLTTLKRMFLKWTEILL